MFRTRWSRPRPPRPWGARKARLQVEALEARTLLSTLTLTPLVQVSGTTPFTDTSDLGGPSGTERQAGSRRTWQCP
jgi:hypothetical protein